jgi:DNA-binding transcriptional regulator YiaG
MDWASIIKQLRKKLALSQSKFGTLLGVSMVSINRWENGQNEPTMKVKRKIKELCEQNGLLFPEELEE